MPENNFQTDGEQFAMDSSSSYKRDDVVFISNELILLPPYVRK